MFVTFIILIIARGFGNLSRYSCLYHGSCIQEFLIQKVHALYFPLDTSFFLSDVKYLKYFVSLSSGSWNHSGWHKPSLSNCSITFEALSVSHDAFSAAVANSKSGLMSVAALAVFVKFFCSNPDFSISSMALFRLIMSISVSSFSSNWIFGPEYCKGDFGELDLDLLLSRLFLSLLSRLRLLDRLLESKKLKGI